MVGPVCSTNETGGDPCHQYSGLGKLALEDPQHISQRREAEWMLDMFIYFEKVIAFRKQTSWIWYQICGFPPLLELREEMCKYHCYLGIFGDCFLGGGGGLLI